MTSRRSSGSSRDERAVEPMRSQNITLSGRRSASAVEDRFRALASSRGVQKFRPASQACRLTKCGDRFEQKATVANHRDAEILEVLGRQLRQHPDVDPVVAECRLVLLKSQVSQELADIHGRTPSVARRIGPVTAACPVVVIELNTALLLKQHELNQ